MFGLGGFLTGWAVGLLQEREFGRQKRQVLEQALAKGRLRESELEMALDRERVLGMGRE